MLKALELIGFKSFADKTRLEFPRGITAVVGPNGSGKSNVVDAIKWVLGEQSVKSLRGKEMVDCIFNGAAGRQPMNAAEATLTFDNTSRLLPIDAHEVHITRRVYRSGEGEYLINRQPSRLRDIRDLFSGTGVATEAYSVIEQGKVDILLQSSARDRRVIFEEAAGISRFKAKKVESLRRLERVEQNLLRLSDIVEEVENRLRSVRLQASKARRYQELAGRLQELRTQVGLADWRKLSATLAAQAAELADLCTQRDRLHAAAEASEAEELLLETSLVETSESIRAGELLVASQREEIARQEANIQHLRSRLHDLDEEALRHRRQLNATRLRAGGLEQQLTETEWAVRAATEEHDRLRGAWSRSEVEQAAMLEQFQAIGAEHDRLRAAYLGGMRSLASLGNESSALATQAETAQNIQARAAERITELQAQLQVLSDEVEACERNRRELDQRATRLHEEWTASQAAINLLRARLTAAHEERQRLESRLAGARERLAVLQELEQRLEGVGAGAQQVLALARGSEPGPWGAVLGLVADLLHAPLQWAPLIDVALGDRGQHLVLRGAAELLDSLRESTLALRGRVGFLLADDPLDSNPRNAPPPADLTHAPGVIARADHLVETASEYQSLAERLLGRTWIVERLEDALRLARGEARGASFVTSAGEWLGADGTLIIGPRQSASALVSRRSELRVLREQVANWASECERAADSARQIGLEIQHEEEREHTLSAQQLQAASDLSDERLRENLAQQRRAQLLTHQAHHATEQAEASAQVEQCTRALAALQEREERAQAELHQLEEALAVQARDLAEVETVRRRLERSATQVQVEFAKSEERLQNLQARRQQFERDQQERARQLADYRAQLSASLQRVRQCEFEILVDESRIAEGYLHKERHLETVVKLIQQREANRARRQVLATQAHQLRGEARQFDERVHALELAAGGIRHERGTLADRLREDYGIELSELEHQPTEDELHQREAVEQEIGELRRKLNHIGNVNLESLEELTQLETRFESLSGQYHDLVRAKDSLAQIIARINADSRRLFAETLEAVKGHFQSLFRKLFGGGQADIVMEEGVDILESGIEILARPPGKEPRSISLLSGGEKTLTCVALLLAIFQYRPSPFCVLDEVDAALDEANIERFIAVLQEFLAWTQFVVVTHSKKTMTCATTLYGVTMQESGVSKRVSVRFEDVSENGEIRLPDRNRLATDGSEPANENSDAA